MLSTAMIFSHLITYLPFCSGHSLIGLSLLLKYFLDRGSDKALPMLKAQFLHQERPVRIPEKLDPTMHVAGLFRLFFVKPTDHAAGIDLSMAAFLSVFEMSDQGIVHT